MAKMDDSSEGRERGSEHPKGPEGGGAPESACAELPRGRVGQPLIAGLPGLPLTPGWPLPVRPPLVLHSPVALPGVADVRVVDAVLVRLLVQKVEHVLDGQGQGRPAVRRAEDGLEQVVHELLQRALRRGPSSDAARPP